MVVYYLDVAEMQKANFIFTVDLELFFQERLESACKSIFFEFKKNELYNIEIRFLCNLLNSKKQEIVSLNIQIGEDDAHHGFSYKSKLEINRILNTKKYIESFQELHDDVKFLSKVHFGGDHWIAREICK